MTALSDFGDAFRLTGGADAVVPPSGHTAWLTTLTAACMAFLAVFALALSLASGRLAERWSSELARTATVRISAPEGQAQTQLAAVMAVLETTPGVASARPLSKEEEMALLVPWLGPDLPIEALPVPQLVEVIETEDGFDAESLRLRLRAEAPGAVLDDHTRWRQPLVEAAGTLRTLGWVSIILITGSLAGMVTLAANASLNANGQVIRVLRLIGARDAFIVRAFVRRFTIRALVGAGGGMGFGVIGVSLLPDASPEGGFLTGLGFDGAQWLLPLLVPVVAGAVAFLATHLAAGRTLREMT